MKRTTLTALMMLAPFAWGCGQPSDSSDGLHGQALVPTAQEIEAACQAADADARDSKPHKVTICHIPPGNPDNAHTINISKKAVQAHLAHGDVLGGCGCSGGGDDNHTPNDDGDSTSDGDDGDTTVPQSPDEPSTSTTDDTPGTNEPTEPADDGSDPSTDNMCDADQTRCSALADCGNNETCDATSGCCVEVYL